MISIVLLTAVALSPPNPDLARADSLFRAGDVTGALALAIEVAGRADDRYDALTAAGAYALALGTITEPDDARAAERHFMRAEELASEAASLRPPSEAVEARYWELAAIGRRAQAAGILEAGRLANRIHEGALGVLRDAPGHPGAHHLLGALYFEIMTLPRLSRLAARTILRGDVFEAADWESAERHLRAAVAGDREAMLYPVDLARLLIERGEAAEARRHLQGVLDAPLTVPPDRVFKDQARALLATLGDR